jgi:glycosyltransferase involved in cell wall biosynthesis
MLAEVAAKGLPREKMTPVPMGVDLETALPHDIAPSDDPRLAGRPVLIYLGAMFRDRGIDLLFEMLQRVRRQFPDVLLAMVGEAEDEQQQQWLHRRAEQLGVADATIWTGWLPIREGWRYVRAADVGLSPIPRGPILDQASPTKILEYLALGLPVVASDLPDQKLVLEESGGGLCVPLTADALADAVCRLLDDEPLRGAMARAGQQYVRERRSYRLLAGALAEKYANLLGAKPENRLDLAVPGPRKP